MKIKNLTEILLNRKAVCIVHYENSDCAGDIQLSVSLILWIF